MLMADMVITQGEANALLNMEKSKADNSKYEFPDSGGRIEIPLISANQRERFLLDVRKARIDLVRGTYQCRGRVVTILARLDIGGSPQKSLI